ncbi:Ribosomal protein S18 acetylase RimI [Carnobacterium iners]|uniref:Ribosomal protein S18 acetylase RimI n=1 Tax=Carnobacterium iners TaxID=1073423 RepID=A0A1X7MQR4_9LACT|nr:GNAT family N-acetyltransferase [Carnobacterium iners]SEK76508.1 Ribosomal protein S18 acetylase RimI [Carnobacterium iners]SMH26376.1 Ribosomal protein S18 acetylase RimI [Carnobacterium iners]
MTRKLVVRRAELKDEPFIKEMLQQAAQWLQTKGSKQWSGILKGEDRHNTSEAIKRGEVFIGRIDDQLAGMFVLWNHQSEWDEEFWGKDSSDAYVYLHRLTVQRSFSGQGISKQLLSEAKLYAKKKKNSAIRLDCIADNAYLNKLYQDIGFTYVGKKIDRIADGEKKDFHLYQCDLDSFN